MPFQTLREALGPRGLRRLLIVAVALALATTIHALVPRVALACSCVGPDMVLTTAAEDPTTIVFTGEVGPAVGQAVPVSVTGWYGGPPPADVITLQVQGGDSAMCGMNPPPAGSEYLFTQFFPDAATEDEVRRQVEVVEGELATVRRLAEG